MRQALYGAHGDRAAEPSDPSIIENVHPRPDILQLDKASADGQEQAAVQLDLVLSPSAISLSEARSGPNSGRGCIRRPWVAAAGSDRWRSQPQAGIRWQCSGSRPGGSRVASRRA